MPKENINGVTMEALRAEVSWRADNGEGTGYVQLATVHTSSPATMPGEKQHDDDNPEPVTLVGWHVDLDREGCNRAIRALRKARDAAYGADA
jgi:hypothetical protein